MKKIISMKEFQGKLFDGMSIMVGGFMVVGTPEKLVDAILESGVKDLTLVCNDAGLPEKGIGKLISAGRVSKLVASHIGLNPEAGRLMSEEKMVVDLIPQGTLAEQIRAGGSGLGGFLTPTGFGTIVQEGKEVITVDGVDYLLEKPMRADLAIILGDQVDKKGNTIYRLTTRNFNPLMATATDMVVCEARAIEEIGDLNPDGIHTPHIFVDFIVDGSDL